MTDVTTVAAGFSFLEGPRWHDGRLWCSDFYDRRVVAVSEDGTVETILATDFQPSGLGWLPDGRLLVVSMLDQRVLRLEPDGSLVVHADLSGVAVGHCNDMWVDPQGRAWVGSFGFDLIGGGAPADSCVFRVDPDGTVSIAAEGLSFPNGTVLFGDTLVVAETIGMRLTAFTIAADSTLVDRRLWADVSGMFPDGTTADASGAIWLADAAGHRCVRVAEGGEVLEEVKAGTGAFACCLGGHDGRTLFIMAAPSFTPEDVADVREGSVLAARVSVPALV
jgi:sugar lactone lactonase YvrE